MLNTESCKIDHHYLSVAQLKLNADKEGKINKFECVRGKAKFRKNDYPKKFAYGQNLFTWATNYVDPKIHCDMEKVFEVFETNLRKNTEYVLNKEWTKLIVLGDEPELKDLISYHFLNLFRNPFRMKMLVETFKPYLKYPNVLVGCGSELELQLKNICERTSSHHNKSLKALYKRFPNECTKYNQWLDLYRLWLTVLIKVFSTHDNKFILEHIVDAWVIDGLSIYIFISIVKSIAQY